ncbi:MAG: 30S ribosomal protein S8 [Candidatus Peribacteraceae bacterium]
MSPLTDPIGDFLTRMRNAQHGRRNECRVQWSKIKQAMCELLKQHGYLEEVRTEGEGIHKELVVKFRKDRPPLTLKRVSTPGGRKYVGTSGIRSLLHGNAMAILSTSSGLLTDKEARKRKVGGEFLCTVS